MDSPKARPQHISEHLASERTVLAWIGTSISVIALGVAINRFSLFLMEFYRIEPQARASNRHAEAVGVGLVILGLVIMCGAIWHYLRVANSIDSQTYRAPRLVMALTSLAVVAGAGAAPVLRFFASPCGEGICPPGSLGSPAPVAPCTCTAGRVA